MGVYSTEAARLFKESEVEFDPNAAGLLEFSIKSQEADHAMFNTILEMDFLEYYQESGHIVVTEEEKTTNTKETIKAIGKKIADAIRKFLQVVQLAIQKLENFVMEKTKLDKKLIAKYGKDLDLAKAKANAGDKQIVVADVDAAAKDIAGFVSSKKEGYQKAVGLTVEQFDNEKAAAKKDAAELVAKFDSYFTKKKISELNDTSFVSLVDGGYKALADKVIGKEAKDLQSTLKTAASNAFKNVASAWTDAKEDSTGKAVLTAEYSYITTLNSSLSKVISFGANVTTHAMAEARKAFIAVAMAANKKEKAAKEEKTNAPEEETNNNESAIDYDGILEYALEVATDNSYENVSFG